MPTLPSIDDILRWEQGEMDLDEEVEFFDGLLSTGAIYSLQGCYQRRCNDLIQAGLIGPHRRGIDETSHYRGC